MKQDTLNKVAGGSFLTTSINESTIFSREDFTDEHKEIEAMVKGFCKEEVAPVKDQLEKKNKELTFSLIKKVGELGLMGVEVPEEYGGMDLDKITGAIVAESSSYSECSSFVVSW